MKWTKNDAKIDKTSFILKVRKTQKQFFLLQFFQKCNENICLILQKLKNILIKIRDYLM